MAFIRLDKVPAPFLVSERLRGVASDPQRERCIDVEPAFAGQVFDARCHGRWATRAVSIAFLIREDLRMGLRACSIAAILICSSQVVVAAEQSATRRVSCSVVRFYVAKYSASAAESWARSKGASEAEIEAARRCLKGWPIVTAQN